MNIGIIGHGYVGRAVAQLFKGRHEILICDPHARPDIPARTARNTPDDLPVWVSSPKELGEQCEFIFVCVPTPQAEDGSCDTSIVAEVCAELKPNRGAVVIIKSTVKPGTTRAIQEGTMDAGVDLVFSPEYAGESSYWSSHKFHSDMRETPFYTFGGPPKSTAKCVELYKPICGPEKRYIQTDSTTAELVKYAENAFFATKIAWCYEFAEICKAFGADWNEVREMWLADPRINPMHTAVFLTNKQPFTGKCFPKDLSAIIEAARKAGYDPSIMATVRSVNKAWPQLTGKEGE